MPPLTIEAFVSLNFFVDGGHNFRVGSGPAIILRWPWGSRPGRRFNQPGVGFRYGPAKKQTHSKNQSGYQEI
ncbi:MAG TPA: hypothetical protein VNH22_18315 [Blastocatellia bacterium]|jgi:hypothetical protein|nr:hypothetical protein [Blastocatellia bacterium]